VLSHFLPFLAIAAVVICTPGPDTALTIRNALAGGRRGGLATAAGVAAGQLAWTVATSFGLAGLLVASEPAFVAVRWAGAAYLVFLGVRSLWAAARRPPDRPGAVADNSHRIVVGLGAARGFRQGLLSNLANPKMAAFFLSLLPQFIPAGDGSLPASLLLGAILCVLTFIWLGGYALLVHRIRYALRGTVRRLLDALAGTVLVGFGIRLAVE
jgi:threonine/homoserine/homoserine lactone efflux protein